MVVVGGSKYYGHYKMTPPTNCRIQDVTSLALFVHLIHKTLWLVKEAVVVVVGGGSKYYDHYKMTPPPTPTAEYKMLPR